jgi:hypothetical protein
VDEAYFGLHARAIRCARRDPRCRRRWIFATQSKKEARERLFCEAASSCGNDRRVLFLAGDDPQRFVQQTALKL